MDFQSIANTKSRKKKMAQKSKLKEYQFKKYGKCLSCKEPVPAESCVIQCPNCGYADNWEDIFYLEDKE